VKPKYQTIRLKEQQGVKSTEGFGQQQLSLIKFRYIARVSTVLSTALLLQLMLTARCCIGVVLLSLLAALSSCKKEEDKAPYVPPLPTAQQKLFGQLTAHKWRLSKHKSWSYGGGKTVETDNYAQLSACQLDNFVQFKTDFTLAVDEGASRCNSADPQSRMTTWSMNQLGTKFLLQEGIMPGYYTTGPILTDLVITDTKLTMTWDSHSMGSGYGVGASTEYTAF
jgi:hypothetical protein